jgi:hypothetical protein
VRNDGWKKIFHKLIHDNDFKRKMQSLDLDNMLESDMLDSFVFLNMDELNVDSVKKFSPDLAKLIIWCQSVVSYHILIHPFTYRNTRGK